MVSETSVTTVYIARTLFKKIPMKMVLEMPVTRDDRTGRNNPHGIQTQGAGKGWIWLSKDL